MGNRHFVPAHFILSRIGAFHKAALSGPVKGLVKSRPGGGLEGDLEAPGKPDCIQTVFSCCDGINPLTRAYGQLMMKVFDGLDGNGRGDFRERLPDERLRSTHGEELYLCRMVGR